MQAGSGQAGDRGLPGVQAVVQRRQRVPPDGGDRGVLLDGEHGGADLPGPHAGIAGGVALAPPLDGGGADAVPAGKRPHARLTPLHGATDCPRRCGAAVDNLAHGASLIARQLSAQQLSAQQLSGSPHHGIE